MLVAWQQGGLCACPRLTSSVQCVIIALQFNIPELRVGTMDSLLHLSDDLSKVRKLRLSRVLQIPGCAEG